MVMTQAVNPVDLVVTFLWPRSMPQSEFPIKRYSRLKLRWSNFNFYLFSLTSLFIYENRWKMVDNPWDFSFWILIFGYLNWMLSKIIFIVMIIWTNVLSVNIFKIIFLVIIILYLLLLFHIIKWLYKHLKIK
jgi:hypothetical protein